jgi:hypothetical protein
LKSSSESSSARRERVVSSISLWSSVSKIVTRLTVRDSVFLMTGPLLCVFVSAQIAPLELAMDPCVFAIASEDLYTAYDPDNAASVVFDGDGHDLVFDAGMNATIRAPIDQELACYTRPNLTVTLAFTASSEFQPLSFHDTISILAISTSP